MAYIGRGINSGDAVSDHLTGSGATVYTLTHDTTTHGVVLTLDGVVQRNATDFTITGNQVTFTTAVASPIAIQIIYTGLTISIGSPGTSTVGIGQLSSTGTASSSTFLRGDNSWAAIPATADEITKSSSDPTASTNPAGGVGTVYLNTTGGEMFCLTDATAGSNVWKNIGEGRGGVPVVYTVATGGTITTDGSYKVHTFTSSSNFSVSTIGNADVEYLVVAGGGSGGMSHGGGGGAGGYRTATGFAVTASTYAVTIGAGGAGRTGSSPGVIGSDSVFSTITSTGGGRGGEVNDDNAGDGGSGGGSGGSSGSIFAAASGNTPSTSPSQGNNGGVTTATTSPYGGGGGGGAGAVGGDRSAGNSGAGGNGTATSISGGSVTYSGGGGASQTVQGSVAGAGGTGGGGAGGLGSSTSGTANLGGGGGGGNTGTSGAGGSGIVIIRYQFQA